MRPRGSHVYTFVNRRVDPVMAVDRHAEPQFRLRHEATTAARR
jgi:hypothetical protein